MIAITGGSVWMGPGRLIRDGVVLTDGEVIAAAGPAASTPVPAEATVIDAKGGTVLPGLIDAHVHLTSTSDLRVRTTPAEFHAHHTPAAVALHAVRNAQRALAMGYTTLRTMGEREWGVEEVKWFSEQGLIALPRVYLAPWPVSMTGGHGDHLDPPYRERRKFDTADGVDEMRQMVRKQKAHGADFIKVFASGGIFGGGNDSPEAPNYSVAELRALVEEAGEYNLPVAAHGHSLEGIRRAVAAGVNSIEHGSMADEEQLGLMAEKGIFLVPTFTIIDQVLKPGSTTILSDEGRAAYQEIVANREQLFRRARELGVKIAAGTDTVGGLFRFGVHARELELYVELGMPPEEALLSATTRPAELMRRPDLGTIKTGATADVVIVRGNPLEDIALLQDRANIRTVIKAGKDVSAALSDPDPEIRRMPL